MRRFEKRKKKKKRKKLSAIRKWKILPVLALSRAAHSSFPPVLSMDGGGENSVGDGGRELSVTVETEWLSGERLRWDRVSPFSLSSVLQPQGMLGSTGPLLMVMTWDPAPCSPYFLEGDLYSVP